MVQFGQKLPVLPLLGNLESLLKPTPEEHPAHSTKKNLVVVRIEKRGLRFRSVSHLAAFMEQIRRVEPELEQTVSFRQMKFAGEAQIQWIVPR